MHMSIHMSLHVHTQARDKAIAINSLTLIGFLSRSEAGVYTCLYTCLCTCLYTLPIHMPVHIAYAHACAYCLCTVSMHIVRWTIQAIVGLSVPTPCRARQSPTTASTPIRAQHSSVPTLLSANTPLCQHCSMPTLLTANTAYCQHCLDSGGGRRSAGTNTTFGGGLVLTDFSWRCELIAAGRSRAAKCQHCLGV